MTGNSYNSWLAAMALINPHPALAAVNLQGTPADLFIGDDFYHYGAFRLSPSFGYAVIPQIYPPKSQGEKNRDFSR